MTSTVEHPSEEGVISVLRDVWALLAAMAMLMAGAGLQGSLLGVRGPAEGFSASTLGVVLAAYYLGYVAGSVAIPRGIAEVGHVRVFSGLASLASVAMVLHGFWLASGAWLILRFVTGLCIAGLFIVAESWLGVAGSPRTRGTLLALYMVVITASLAGSQFLLGVADVDGPALFVVTASLVSLSVVPVALVPLPSPPLTQVSPYSLRRLTTEAPLAAVGSAVSGMGVAAAFGFGAVAATALGFDLEGVAVFVAAVPVGSVLLQIPLGRLSDHTDRRRVIAAVAAAGSGIAAIGALGTDGANLAVYAGIALVLGGVVFPLYSLAMAHLTDYLEPDQVVSAGSKMIIVNGLAAAASQVVAGALIETSGVAAFFWYLAVVLGVVSAYALYRITRRESAEEPVHFAPVAHLTSTEGLELVFEEERGVEVAR